MVVLDGAVDVAGTAVAAGEDAALDTGGKLTVTAATDDTRVYIAAIGPEILLGSEPEVVRTGSGDAGSAPEIVPDANPNPSDTAGSGGVDLFEVGCDAVQPGLSFQDLRAACTTQVPSRTVWLGTSAGESIATTAPMGAPAADMRVTFDPVRAGNSSLFLGGLEGEGWALVTTYRGNPNAGGVAPVQNPGNVLADGEYYACFSFYQPA